MQQEPMHVSDVFKKLIAASPYQDKLKEAAVVCTWNELMPPVVVKRTQRIFVRNHQLFLQITSAPLRQEIEYAKSDLLMKLTAAIPNYSLQGIVWL